MSVQDERDETLRNAPVSEYLQVHSHANGGFKSFLRSNLFTALVIFFLGQAVLVGGAIIGMYWRLSNFTEWKGQVDKTMEVFNKQGSPALRAEVEFHIREESVKYGELAARVKSIEDDTKHFDVMEAEHLRLTKDVENLKNGKK